MLWCKKLLGLFLSVMVYWIFFFKPLMVQVFLIIFISLFYINTFKNVFKVYNENLAKRILFRESCKYFFLEYSIYFIISIQTRDVVCFEKCLTPFKISLLNFYWSCLLFRYYINKTKQIKCTFHDNRSQRWKSNEILIPFFFSLEKEWYKSQLKKKHSKF